MQVRSATPDDADGIAAVHAAGWRTAFVGIVDQRYLDRYDGAPELRRRHLDSPSPNHVELVAVQESHILGFIAGGSAYDDPSLYELQACYVEPSHWRTGIGRQLAAAFLARVAGQGGRTVMLWTPREAHRTRQFYESVGFTFTGDETIADRQGPVPLVCYRRVFDRDQSPQ